MAVWRQFDGKEYSLYASRFEPGAGWGEAVLIETHDQEAVYPEVAMDDEGNAMAVWVQRRCIERNCISSNVWINSYQDGKSWGTARRLSANGAGIQVAVSARRHFVVVWNEMYGFFWKRWGVRANFFEVEKGWGTPVWIHKGSGNSFHPQVAVAPDGNAIVTWEQIQGNRRSIWISSSIGESY